MLVDRSLFEPKPNTENPGLSGNYQILDFFRDFPQADSRSLFGVRQCFYMLAIRTHRENDDSGIVVR